MAKHTVFILIQFGNNDDGKKKTKFGVIICLVPHVWDTVDLFYPWIHTGADHSMLSKLIKNISSDTKGAYT